VAGSCRKSATPSVEGCGQAERAVGWCNTKPGRAWGQRYALGRRGGNNSMQQEALQTGVGEQQHTSCLFGGAGVEEIKMARTDWCLHRAGREWAWDTAAGMQ
jgi:hypothetical protein